ncbi:MAG: hypothetical protein HQ595_01730 [Candidatus Omnitrophica bacterium]|nr:hypothetical protein [Candidatus Omnitrophota bacterium]
MVELKKICQSELKLKLVTFFQENPSTVDTSRGIAAWLNLDRKQIKNALDYLVGQKILITHKIGVSLAYCLTQDKKVLDQISNFLQKNTKV